MSKKYNEELNKIVMNDDMKRRILQNVLAANESSEEKNIKVETIVPKVKKYNNLKRNMQVAAAGFTVVLCLSIAKTYPMLLKSEPNDLKQNETAESQNDENNDLKSSDDNGLVNNNDSKETSDNDNKEDQTLNQNNNINKNSSDSSKKEESNAVSEIETEEKNKDNSQSNSGSEVVQSQAAQTNDNKATGNSNISSKTNTEETDNNKENKNSTNAEQKTKNEDVMLDKVPVNNTDNGGLEKSVMSEEDVNYNQEYKTLDEAEKALNLKVNPLKTLPKGFNTESISVISNEIIQVDYNDGSNNITFRAGKGIDNISGDYIVYQVKNKVKVNGIKVDLQGNKNKEYNLAVWEKDGISYSISAENGIDEKTILDMIS